MKQFFFKIQVKYWLLSYLCKNDYFLCDLQHLQRVSLNEHMVFLNRSMSGDVKNSPPGSPKIEQVPEVSSTSSIAFIQSIFAAKDVSLLTTEVDINILFNIYISFTLNPHLSGRMFGNHLLLYTSI